MRRRLPSLLLLCAWLLAGVGIRSTLARPRTPEAESPSVPACSDLWRCRLPQEIARTDRFLREHRYGLPFALDPRPLDYPLEVLRLNVMSQALGYLNLYRTGRQAAYRQEAMARIEYLLALGEAALGNGPRDGMYGYLMLEAYEAFGDERLLLAGRRAAARCANTAPEDLIMNGGLMCALNHAALARIDGNAFSNAVADEILERTSSKQFEDGAFPHLPVREAGKNTNYTAWMATELLLIRDLRPQSELAEYLLLASLEFLRERTLPSGEIEWADSTTNYASDPGNGDSRGWTSELASIALDLALGGRRHEAALVLQHLFALRMKAEALGGYPDKYAFIHPENPWETGRPSITRTSLIFWYLTLIRRYDLECSSGEGPCAAIESDCSGLYRELGLCDGGESGEHRCVAGRLTRCFDSARVRMRTGQVCFKRAGPDVSLAYPDLSGCVVRGTALCVGERCRDQCLDPVLDECGPASRKNPEGGRRPSEVRPADPGLDAARAHGVPFDLEPAGAIAGIREDLSLQVVKVRRSDSGMRVELHAHHHGNRTVPAGRVSLVTRDGMVLATAAVAMTARGTTSVTLESARADTVYARLGAGPTDFESDTLNNVAVVALDDAESGPAKGEFAPTGGNDAGPVRVGVRDARHFVITIDRPATGELTIHDVAGRCVRAIWRGGLDAGAHPFEWDGRDRSGVRVARGVYFARFSTASGHAAGRVIILQ